MKLNNNLPNFLIFYFKFKFIDILEQAKLVFCIDILIDRNLFIKDNFFINFLNFNFNGLI